MYAIFDTVLLIMQICCCVL